MAKTMSMNNTFEYIRINKDKDTAIMSLTDEKGGISGDQAKIRIRWLSNSTNGQDSW